MKKRFNKKTKKVSKAVRTYVQKAIAQEPEKKQWYYQHPAINPVSNTVGNKFYFNWCGGPQTAVGNTDPFKQGPQSYQRLGSDIMIHEIEIKAAISYVAVGANTNCIRMLIIRDKDPQNATIVMGDILASVAADEGVWSPYKETGKSEVEILYDKTYQLKSLIGTRSGAAYNQSTLAIAHFRHKFKRPIKCTYYPDAAQASNIVGTGIERNGLVAVFLEDGGGTAYRLDAVRTNCIFTDA